LLFVSIESLGSLDELELSWSALGTKTTTIVDVYSSKHQLQQNSYQVIKLFELIFFYIRHHET
jgi:hypothetical protein